MTKINFFETILKFSVRLVILCSCLSGFGVAVLFLNGLVTSTLNTREGLKKKKKPKLIC